MSAGGRWMTAALIVVGCACALMLALYACLLVPLRVDGRLIPVAPVLAAITTAGIPRALLRAGVPTWGAALPFVAWLGLVAYISTGTSSGDVVLPGSGGASYVAYGVMIGGIVGGLASLGWRSIAPRAPR